MSRKSPRFLDFVQYGELAEFMDQEWDMIQKEMIPMTIFARRASQKLGFEVTASNVRMVCKKKEWVWPQTRGQGASRGQDRVKILAGIVLRICMEQVTTEDVQALRDMSNGKAIGMDESFKRRVKGGEV